MSTPPANPARSVWKFLASAKLAIALLVILAVASILGTLLPQGEPASTYFEHFRPAVAKLILAAQLDHLYTSVWYLALLFGLALNLIVCSLDRFPKTWKMIRRSPDPDGLHLPKLSLRREIYTGLSPEAVMEAARRAAKSLGPPVEGKAGANSEKTIFFAQSGGWSRLGAYVIHLSLLILFAAGMITGLAGFKGFVTIHEGEAVDALVLKGGREVPLGFTVRLDKFTFERYPNGAPKTYRSDLTFIVDGKEVRKAAVEVNDPVTFGRITFYQSTYGQSLGEWIEIAILPDGGQKRIVRLPMEGETEVPGLGRVSVLGFASNFRNIGPTARLEIKPGDGGKPKTYFVFTREPFQMPRQEGQTLSLAGFDSKYYTGLQANYDPGVGLLWAGSILMLVGLLVAFFWSHRRLWVEVCPHKNGARITLAASANRNRPAMERRFEVICQELEDSLAQLTNGKRS